MSRYIRISKNRRTSLVFDQRKITVAEMRVKWHSCYTLSSEKVRTYNNLTDKLGLLCKTHPYVTTGHVSMSIYDYYMTSV